MHACVCEYACGGHVLSKILLIHMTRPRVRSGSCKVCMAQDRGGHLEIQNGGIMLQDPDRYHTNMYGDKNPAEKIMTLCPPDL